MISRYTENYIIKKGEQTAILKTNLEESEVLKIIQQTQQHENYNQSYFIENIEYIQEELSKLACNYEVINLNDLETILMR